MRAAHATASASRSRSTLIFIGCLPPGPRGSPQSLFLVGQEISRSRTSSGRWTMWTTTVPAGQDGEWCPDEVCRTVCAGGSCGGRPTILSADPMRPQRCPQPVHGGSGHEKPCCQASLSTSGLRLDPVGQLADLVVDRPALG